MGQAVGWLIEVASRKLAVTAVAGAAAATGTIELTWPMAVVEVAYIAGQTVVDTWGESGAAEGKEKGEAAIYGAPPVLSCCVYFKPKDAPSARFASDDRFAGRCSVAYRVHFVCHVLPGRFC